MSIRLHCLDVFAAVATATLSLPFSSARAAPPVEAARLERQIYIMGTMLFLLVEAPTGQVALNASEAAVRAVEGVERRLSTWRSDTELAILNRHPAGAELTLSPKLSADLAAVVRLWQLTGGAFDPGIGALVAAWDLRGTGRRPTSRELAAARAASGLRHLRLYSSGAVRGHPQLCLDEGGFGKGAALDAALATLAAAGATRALLDFGGQVAVLPEETGFDLSLAHPGEAGTGVATLRLFAGSVATSGNGQRHRAGRPPHLLDPRTGRPAPDFGSLSVWAPSALEADALSTGLFVLGPEAALGWAQRHPQYGVIVVERGKKRPRLRLSGALADGRLPLIVTALDLANGN